MLGEPDVQLEVQKVEISTRGKVALAVSGTVFAIIGAVTLFVLVTFAAYKTPSVAMAPAYGAGSRVMARPVAAGDIQRGDAVIAQRPAGTGQFRPTISRVVALGGDRIEAREGVLHVNGKPADEPYLEAGTQTEGVNPTSVPEGSAFLLGDNRLNSADSRVHGPVPLENIDERVVADWPMDWASLGATLVSGVAFGVTLIFVLVRRRRPLRPARATGQARG